MESINALIHLTGILIYSSNNAFLNWTRVVGIGDIRRLRTLLCSASHRCSIGGQTWTVWWPVEWEIIMVSQKATTNWLHGARHYHAVKSIAQEGLQWGGGLHPCNLLLFFFSFFFFFLIWVLRPFQEYFTYIEPIVHQR